MGAAALAFDPLAHRYTLDGRELIAVTQVLKEAGLVDDRWWTDEACLRGRYVHEAILLHHEGDLAEDSLDPALAPYFTAYRQFLADTRFRAESVEQRVYHEALGYAGTYDLLGRFPTQTIGGWDLIDVKSGAVPSWVGIQLAGYSRAICNGTMKLLRRWALNLQGDGTYRLVRCNDLNDDKLFLSALAIAQWRRRYRQGA